MKIAEEKTLLQFAKIQVARAKLVYWTVFRFLASGFRETSGVLFVSRGTQYYGTWMMHT